MTPHIHAILAELTREQTLRREVYARAVARDPEKRETLAGQWERLVDARRYLEGSAKPGELPNSVTQCLTELRREQRARARFYPEWVKNRRITLEDAARQNALLAQAIDELERMLPPKIINLNQPTLFG